MSPPSIGLLSWAILLALASVAGAADGLPGVQAGTTFAAPLAAPDNSIVLVPVASGFELPVLVTNAADGSNRLFVLERGGKIKVVKNGVVNPTPFLDVSSIIASELGEQGLLGLAFHPKYATNGRFFVYYTAKPPPEVGNNTLVENAVSGDPDVANPTPVRTLFSLVDRATNHNGGTIAFGRDSYLYVGMGDEGGNPDNNAQNLLALYGKLLRLDVDNGGNPFPPDFTYAIPPTNPFVGQPGARLEIWALGFRNPYRWSFDRLTGDIFVGDVGQNTYEEIDLLPVGAGGLNLGWDNREGAHCYLPPSGCATSGRLDPILEYSHSSNGTGCSSVTGGYRYRGTQNPSLQGVYLYADFCTGRIFKGIFGRSGSLLPGIWSSVEALATNQNISSFGEDEAGEIYTTSYFGGTLYRIAESTPPLACAIRPRVNVQSSRTGPGTLDVFASVTDNSTVPANELRSIAFTRIENAFVTIGSEVDRQTTFTATLPSGTRLARVTVRRNQAGQAMNVGFSATDLCGPWGSFVGLGSPAP